MKRHNNLFDKIVDKDNLLLAYKKAKKHKSWQQKVIRVEKDLDNLIEELRLSLINGTYKTAEYRTKKIYEPKERTIYVLPFYPDRIVHHAIMNILEPIWDNLFISDSYACRNGKGQHKGSQKCMEFVRKNKYCLKCDISKFYPSINHEILKLIIRKKIKCKRTLNLLDTIIDSIDGETNIPIGNYLSQWFGNLYLNELDMFMKHDNKIKCYIRYCDDFLLFSNDKALLKEMAIKIKDYVENILKLRLSKCNLFPTSQGIDFLGYRHFSSGYILVRKTTAKRMKKRIRRLKWELAKKKITNDRALSVIGSISGWLKWANTYNLQKEVLLMNKFSDFAEEKFIGEKIKISKVLNKEIKVLAFQVKKSKIEKDGFYIQMQIEVDDERKVLFTNSSVLKDQLEKYKDNLPFITTIIQPKKYFSFS